MSEATRLLSENKTSLYKKEIEWLEGWFKDVKLLFYFEEKTEMISE